jgi:hypothetical protein
LANRLSPEPGRLAGAESEHSSRVLVAPFLIAAPLAANDNKAPLLTKLRRLAFLTVAALAAAWVFWVGLLR